MNKLLILLILFCFVGQVKADEFDDMKAKQKAFAASLSVGDCFRYERFSKAKFSFEKDHMVTEHLHVVMAKDGNGLLIAQPEPNCTAKLSESHKCNYWFRTITLDYPFLIQGEEKKYVCPKELSLKNMVRKLKKSKDSEEYNLGGLYGNH